MIFLEVLLKSLKIVQLLSLRKDTESSKEYWRIRDEKNISDKLAVKAKMFHNNINRSKYSF